MDRFARDDGAVIARSVATKQSTSSQRVPPAWIASLALAMTEGASD
jgi:hypothetical protein